MKKKIKLLVSDIDGVLTDGKIFLINPYNGQEVKSLCFKDFDAVGMLKEIRVGLCLITGEDNSFVDEVERRFSPIFCYRGCKKKMEAIEEICRQTNIEMGEIAYIGDGKYDLPVIEAVGLGMCPKDAIHEVKSISDIKLKTKGGCGCLAEAFTIIYKYNRSIQNRVERHNISKN